MEDGDKQHKMNGNDESNGGMKRRRNEKRKKKKPHLFQFDAAFFPFTPLDADSMLFADLNTGVFSLTVGCCVECCSCVYGGPRREIDGVRIKIRIRAKWGMNA